MLQKSGRLVLWEAMFILELHSAETQALYKSIFVIIIFLFVFICPFHIAFNCNKFCILLLITDYFCTLLITKFFST